MSSEKVVFHLNKLVRAKLPDDMRARGQQPEVRQLEGREKTLAKIAKLLEEAGELDPDSPTYPEELADVLQIVTELVRDCSGEDVEKIRREKLAKKGGFDAGLFVTKLVLDPDDEWVEYYRREPEKYPEERYDR